MNISAYIFGSLGSGYSQYPSDYTQDIFQQISALSSAPTQIAVHRDDKLIYYVYLRKLEAGQYIGLCVILNGMMLTDFKEMFTIFENTITNIVVNGVILQFNDRGGIVSKVNHLYTNQTEISRITDNLRNDFAKLERTCQVLPPVSYSVAKSDVKRFAVEDDINSIINASAIFNYTFIYKQKNYNTQSLSNYIAVLSKVSKERDELKERCSSLSATLAKTRAQKRNMQWVSFLGAVAILFGIILWNKVLFPSEVTHYETDKFIYYGPISNKKPNGLGVAFYLPNDEYDRKYYIGNFVNGVPSDTAAMLFYKAGDYFYGHIEGENFINGMQYVNSDNSYFRGEFKGGRSYNGIWYDYKQSYRLFEGEVY